MNVDMVPRDSSLLSRETAMQRLNSRRLTLQHLENRSVPAGLIAMPSASYLALPENIPGPVQLVEAKTASIATNLAASPVSAATNQPVVVSGTKGIQAVELARWSNTSVNNFLAVVTDRAAPAKIEIGFVPTFNRANPYGNASKVVDSLVSAGKQVSITVHLGFHLGNASNGTTNTAELNQLRSDAKAFNDKFLSKYGGKANVSIKLSPSLEDEWRQPQPSRPVDQVFQAVGSQLTYSTSNVQFQRSNNQGDDSGRSSFAFTDGLKHQRTLRMLQEMHGTVGRATGYEVYSNDGNFVYFDGDTDRNGRADENSKSLRDTPVPPDTYSLSQFSSKLVANRYGGTVLLWRPAYNLFTKKADALGVFEFHKPGTAPESRSDSDRNPAFDQTEQTVLRIFLGMKS